MILPAVSSIYFRFDLFYFYFFFPPLAVDLCLSKEEYADALVLASLGGPELWARAQQAFFVKHKSAFMRDTVSAIVRKDLSALIANSPAEKWRETLAMLLTYAQGDKFSSLCADLGEKLEKNPNYLSGAAIVYLFSCNVDKLLSCW